MVLAIDVGNSNIVIGVYEDGSLLFSSRMKTDIQKTEAEYAIMLHSLLKLNRFDPENMVGAAISSVVPSLNQIIADAVLMLKKVTVVCVGPGVKTGLNIRIDDPASTGSDLVCTGVGALDRFPLPCIVIDLGTATKITVVDKNGAFIGGSILPGVMISLASLSSAAAQLPTIGLSGNIKVIGSNTVDCMLSGSVLGTASMIDGMIERYRQQLGEIGSIVACGGLVDAIIPHCNTPITIHKHLLLDGLYSIYRRNAPNPPSASL